MNSSSNSYEYNLMSAEKRSLQCSTATAAIRLLLMSRELQQEKLGSQTISLAAMIPPRMTPLKTASFNFLA